MVHSEPSERAAQAIVDRLLRDESIETASAGSVVKELQAVFERTDWYERQADALKAELITTLEDSTHVEELYVDDEMLLRIVSAALLDYFAVMQKRGFARPREPRHEVVAAAKAADDTPTLAELGFAFPLFEGTRQDADVDDAGICTACLERAELRFHGACYTCFRTDRVRVTQNTELGLVTPEDALAGLTGGVPASLDLDPRGTRSSPSDENDGDADDPFVRFHVDVQPLQELLRTPSYTTWQGESWLFCHAAPMIFLGDRAVVDLDPEDLPAMLAPEVIDDPEEFLDEVLQQKRFLYVFRCAHCNERRAHWERS